MDINLGSQAEALRHKKGLSLRDLAAKAGVSASTLSRFERGNTDILFSTVLTVFEALEAPLFIGISGSRWCDIRTLAAKLELKRKIIELVEEL